MKKINLLYFASSRPPYEQEGHVPSCVFYGTNGLRRDMAFTFDVRWRRPKSWSLLFRPIERWISAKTGVGFRLDQMLVHLGALRKADVILAETDSSGLPLLLLKRLGFLKPKVGFISAGLVNELEQQQHSLLFRFYRWILQAADFIVCWSPLEERMYRELVHARSFFVRLEADLDFYRPDERVHEEEFLLCVGRDVGRDWRTLLQALEMTQLPARVITSLHRVKGLRLPPYVELSTQMLEYPVFLDLYRKARLVVVNLPEIHRFTGQRAVLESMAMGKATIAAKTQSLVGTYPLHDGEDVVFYTPGDARDLARKIMELWEDGAKRTMLGRNARRFVEQLPRDAFYQGVRAIILNLFPRYEEKEGTTE